MWGSYVGLTDGAKIREAGRTGQEQPAVATGIVHATPARGTIDTHIGPNPRGSPRRGARMHTPRFAPIATAIVLVTSALPTSADPRTPAIRRSAVVTGTPAIADAVTPPFRTLVADVVSQPTLTATATDTPFAAHPHIYDWLIEHPDRASVAWRRMGVPCVEITQTAGGTFHWAEDGSELAWQVAGRTAQGMIWYATGKVKPGPLLPTVPVRAVAVLRAPRQPDDLGDAGELRPTVTVYLLTDSRAANAVLRVAGPAAPRMAEQGAEQLLLFFAGPARYIYRHPDQFEKLLSPAK